MESPLTGDGLIYVENALRRCLTTDKLCGVTNGASVDWAEFYKDQLDFRRIVLEALKKRLAKPDEQQLTRFSG